MDKKNTCYRCSSVDDLENQWAKSKPWIGQQLTQRVLPATWGTRPELGLSPTGNFFCWVCHFKIKNGREPLKFEIDHHKNEIDHHNGIKHSYPDLCELCAPQECMSDKIINPNKYLISWGRNPPECSGNLLAWLSMENLFCEEIAYVEVKNGNEIIFYKFEKKDFDISFSTCGGEIQEIEDIVRFVMIDDSYFTVEPTNYTYSTTHLKYHTPVTRPECLLTGLSKILKPKIYDW